MTSCRTLFISALLATCLSAVNAECGDNGGAELGWGTQADSDANGSNPRSVLGFRTTGPFDAAGNPILSVIATNAGYSADYYAFKAFLCGQASPNAYPQTTFGPVLSADSIRAQTSPALCLTASALTGSNITVALLPCRNDIATPPVATQTFQWIGTAFITYGFAFVGNQSGLPLDARTPTNYVPSLVSISTTTNENETTANVTGGAYLRLDYLPGGLPASTGRETGMVLSLSDD